MQAIQPLDSFTEVLAAGNFYFVALAVKPQKAVPDHQAAKPGVGEKHVAAFAEKQERKLPLACPFNCCRQLIDFVDPGKPIGNAADANRGELSQRNPRDQIEFRHGFQP